MEYTQFCKTMGERIKKVRKMTGMNQDTFAKAIGLSRTSLVGYEKGNSYSTLSTNCLRRLCFLTGISPAYFLGLTDAMRDDQCDIYEISGLLADDIRYLNLHGDDVRFLRYQLGNELFWLLIKHIEMFRDIYLFQQIDNDDSKFLRFKIHELLDSILTGRISRNPADENITYEAYMSELRNIIEKTSKYVILPPDNNASAQQPPSNPNEESEEFEHYFAAFRTKFGFDHNRYKE